MVACKVCNHLIGKCCYGSEPECHKADCCDSVLCLCSGLNIIDVESKE